MNIELHIKQEGGYTEQLDLYPDETISYIVKGIDFLKFDRQYAAFTRRFNIPATPKNNRLLKYFGQLDIQNSYNPHKAIPAYLVISETITYVGSIELSQSVNQEGDVKQYAIGFYSEAFNIKARISEDSLTDVDWSRFDFDLNRENMLLSWDYDLNDGEVVIPIMAHEVDYCYMPIPAYSNIPCNIASSEPVLIDNDGVVTLVSVGVRVDHQKPAYLLKAFVENIFDNYGITITEWSDDIDTFLQDLYIMPSKVAGAMVDTEVLQDLVCIVENSRVTGQGIDNAFEKVNYTVEVQDIQDQFDLSTDRFTAYATGVHTFAFSFRNIDTVLLDGTLTLEVRYGSGAATDTYTDVASVGSIIVSAYLNAGDYIEFWVKQDIGAEYDYYFYLNLTDFPSTIYDQTINASITMPDMKVWDFLSKFFDTYNLLMITDDSDPNGNIRIISKVEYYRSGAKRDITPYIDFSKQAFTKVNVDDVIILNHKQGEDKMNEAFRQVALRSFGELKYYADVDFSTADYDVTSDFTIFPPAYMLNLASNGDPIGVTNLLLHSQFNTEGEPIQSDFLLFYFNGSSDCINYWLQDGVDPLTQLPTYAPITTWGYYSANSIYPSNSLARTTTYTPENPPSGFVATNTISRNFFLDYLKFLYANSARNVTMSGYIPTATLLEMDLSDTLIINGLQYLINQYEYNWTTQETKLDLLLIDDSFSPVFPTEVEDNGNITFNSTPSKMDLLTWSSRTTSTPSVYSWTYWQRKLPLKSMIPYAVHNGLFVNEINNGKAKISGGVIAAYPLTTTPTQSSLCTFIDYQKFIDATVSPDNFYVYESSNYQLTFSIESNVGVKNIVLHCDVIVGASTVFYYSIQMRNNKIFTAGFTTTFWADSGTNIYLKLYADAADTLPVNVSAITLIRN